MKYLIWLTVLVPVLCLAGEVKGHKPKDSELSAMNGIAARYVPLEQKRREIERDIQALMVERDAVIAEVSSRIGKTVNFDFERREWVEK